MEVWRLSVSGDERVARLLWRGLWKGLWRLLWRGLWKGLWRLLWKGLWRGERRGGGRRQLGRELGRSGMVHLETRAGGQQAFLFLWIDGERCDVECGLGVEDDERSDAAELRHEATCDALVGGCGGDRPPRDHLSRLVLVVQVGGDAAPEPYRSGRHRIHRLEEEAKVAQVLGHLGVDLTQRPIELTVDRVARVEHDRSVLVGAHRLDRPTCPALREHFPARDARRDRAEIRDAVGQASLLERRRERKIPQPPERIVDFRTGLLCGSRTVGTAGRWGRWGPAAGRLGGTDLSGHP